MVLQICSPQRRLDGWEVVSPSGKPRDWIVIQVLAAKTDTTRQWAWKAKAEYIELTLKSVVAQTVKPLKWIIVNDGSTDNTGEIVSRYAALYPWIDLVEMPKRTERHFGGKAEAVNSGHKRVSELRFDVLGNLDSDVSFEPDYFEFLMNRFNENPNLGVAGTNLPQRQFLSHNSHVF